MMVAQSIAQIWARILIEIFNKWGVKNLCIAPGSRSTCLVKAAYDFGGFNITTHYDERSLCFFALGCAKVSRVPAVVITTSGSAVANLVPAASEAKKMCVPLIMVTADRPEELHHCGANQTLIQEPLLISSVVHQYTSCIPTKDPHALQSFIINIHKVLSHSFQGPVHINMPFREPFLSNKVYDFSDVLRQVTIDPPPTEHDSKIGSPIILSDSWKNKRIIALVSHTVRPLDELALIQWSKQCNVPLISDCGSSLSYRQDIYRSMDSMCEKMQVSGNMPDFIICIGSKWISKSVHQFLKSVTHGFLCHDFPESQNWLKLKWDEYRVPTETASLVSMLPIIHGCEHYKETIHTLNDSQEVSKPEVFNEQYCIQAFSSIIYQHNMVFLGNSLSVRLAASYLLNKAPNLRSVTQRGLSGIDGLVSTAAGIAHASGECTIAIVGDLSCLHDINGLYFLKAVHVPVILIVLNNNGGRIFESLAVKKEPCFESLFVLPTGLDLSHIATTFGLHYQAIDSIESCEMFLNKGIYNQLDSDKKSMVIECKISGQKES